MASEKQASAERAGKRQGRRGEPPARKSGAESIPEDVGPTDPERVPRKDSRGPQPEGEAGRGIRERKGGKR